MSKFIKPAVKALDKLYGFDQGPTATDQLNLPAGIQLVHDVSREAEVASGFGLEEGWYNTVLGAGIVHPGAGTIDTLVDLYGLIFSPTSGIDVYQYDVWLFDVVLSPLGVGAFTSGWVNTPVGPIAGGGSRIFRRWTGELVRNAGGQSWPIPTYEYKYPLRIFPPSSTITIVSTAGAAVNITPRGFFWIGAKGSLPPHVA